ncbi:hypothetical protein HTSR_0218 [Halodesulfurarchaeum formicicum]|uniref:DUF1059 domain-containing protein n=1 Tax=Halodesulfurarchaeum formicicum TaxID=1873524 RepID=A0A1D8S251_9EURY|nr:DUF1059 domain-containing protein [Halodesulfurarchaeum formicicum]AOW79420.1 hypothetical protein HTSR_0218 [Halodesulfurarchaeum formicicum]APE94673.1 hypothetical protein HSR6_0205 [Halodesulfurarchaeum formicicum]
MSLIVSLAMSQQVECIVDGCHGVCEGETEEEVLSEVEAHVQEAHPDLTLDEETVGAVKAEIETV